MQRLEAVETHAEGATVAQLSDSSCPSLAGLFVVDLLFDFSIADRITKVLVVGFRCGVLPMELLRGQGVLVLLY